MIFKYLKNITGSVFSGLLAAGFFLALFQNCSTQKNGFAHRAYHNTTAHYNGFFNARESFKDGVMQIENAYQEDYTQILPVFIYGDESAAKGVYPQMDKAIEKCEKVIQRHSIYIKRKEYVDWIDDCWLLIGKCHFFKKEYEDAREKFEYVARQFKDKDIHFDAFIWLARTYLQMQQIEKSGKILDLIAAEAEFPVKLKSEYAAVYADYYMRQRNYMLAIPELRTAIAYEKNRKKRVRYLFILAQLYQEESDFRRASDYYAQVAKMNPPYEMEFYAKINRALAYNVGAGNKDEIKKELNKMLRDDKNTDYYDQIYYALADLYLKEGEQQTAVEMLKKSVSSSRSNNNQKGLSYLKLADIFFENDPPDYALAQAYYDSTVVFIDKTRADFKDILNKRNSLSRLVRDLLIIHSEDSLQKLAALTEKERDAIIEDIIQKVIEEEERQKQEAEANYLFANENKYNSQNAGNGANWYFYNPSTLSFGFSEFKRVWGERKLEDNWRRKDKSSFISDDADLLEAFESSETDTVKGAEDKKNKNYYLKNIPLTDKKLNISHNKIIEALYDLGLVYKERLNDNEMAIETFKQLVEQYDTCRYALSSYYQLYRLYMAEEDDENAAYFKNLILSKAPESEYAQLIKNPNYFVEKQKATTAVQDYYKQTFRLYKQRSWTATLNRCIASDSIYPKSKLSPKFHLLRAISLGKISGRDTFIIELKKVIALHPDQAEAKEAKRIIDILNKGKKKSSPLPKNNTAKYAFNPSATHRFIFVFPNKNNKTSELKKQISNFNQKYFRLQQFEMNNLFLVNGKTQMITVKGFKNKERAMNYYNTFSEHCEIMKKSNAEDFVIFTISSGNFAKFYRDKDIDKYLSFFNKHYLENQ